MKPLKNTANQRNNSYLKLYSYFKDLSEKSLLVKGFVGYSSTELNNKNQSFEGLDSPFLALWKYEKGYTGENENTLSTIEAGFVILQTGVPIDDFTKQYQAVDDCETIARHILSRIVKDAHNPNHFLYGISFENP